MTIRETPRLRLVAVGTGRDGTQSLYHMIQESLGGEGGAMHEYASREFYRAFCQYKETGNAEHVERIRRMIRDCPYEYIVGNGYAAILPLIAEECGDDIRIIHLRRADREACIRSLMTNCELFPDAYKYYSRSEQAVWERMAAFHFGEMSPLAWAALPLPDKFAWYYDKTHALIEDGKRLFRSYYDVETERLSTEAVRETIARAVHGGVPGRLPGPTHLNAHSIDLTAASPEHRFKMFWLMGRLDLLKLAEDDVYGIEYFIDKFIAWTGYQIAGAPQLGTAPRLAPERIQSNLARAEELLCMAQREVSALKAMLAERGSEDASSTR